MATAKPKTKPEEVEKKKEKALAEFTRDNLMIIGPGLAMYTAKELEDCKEEGFFLQRRAKEFGIRKEWVVLVTDKKTVIHVVVN